MKNLLLATSLLLLATLASAQTVSVTGPVTAACGESKTYYIEFRDAFGSVIAPPSGTATWYTYNGVLSGTSDTQATVQWNGSGWVAYEMVTFDNYYYDSENVTVSVPSAPGTSAASSITTTSFTANWQAVAGATGYQLDVSTDNFATFISGYNNLPVTGTSRNITGLSAGTYVYRVRAVTACGTTNSSAGVSVPLFPLVPTPTAATSVATTSFTANWNAVVAATYLLDVSTSSSFTSFVSGYQNKAVTPTSQSVTGLAPGTPYYYRVRATNSSGTSAYSTSTSVITTLAAPTANAATAMLGSSFTANWSAVTGATGYRLDVATDAGFTSILSAYNNKSVTGTSHGISGLSPGTYYYYRLRATTASQTSVNSSTITTATTISAPIVNAADQYTSNGFRASWSVSTGATSYRLDVSKYSNFSSMVSGYNNLTVSGTSHTVTGLTEKTSYYYRVRSVSAASVTSGSSTSSPPANLDQNYVRVIDVLKEGLTTDAQVLAAPLGQTAVKYDFFDGLGRPVQSVLKQQSPGALDIVQPVVYDQFGRETVKYLPYSSGTDGWFKADFKDKDQAGYDTSPQYQFYQTTSAVAQDVAPYAATVFETSPLNRVLRQGAPGTAWQPNTSTYASPTDRAIPMAYDFNSSATEVLRWTCTDPATDTAFATVAAGTGNVYYAVNTLHRKKSKDEHRYEVIEYTDSEGRVVLKRVQAVTGANVAINDTNFASTYYIYNRLGQLVCVVPPEATKRLAAEYFAGTVTTAQKETFLARWAFRYRYDERGRMMMKQVPGGARVFMVYDTRDRLVMTQDGNQRNPKKWLVTKYDTLNRPVITALYTHGTKITQQAMSALISGSKFCESYNGTAATHGYTNTVWPIASLETLSATYYDNYNFKTIISSSAGEFDYRNTHLVGQRSTHRYNVVGQVTGTKTLVLGTTTYLWGVNYYDDQYRVIQATTTAYSGIYTRTTNLYDFTRLTKTKTTQFASGRLTDVVRRPVYDHAGRTTELWHRIGKDSIRIVKNEYNELGQLIRKKLHTVNTASTFQQQVDHRYNIRGWLTRMNFADLGTADGGPQDLFGFELGYNASIGVASPTLQYNGNISAMKWSTNLGLSTVDQVGYKFMYDVMNRLTAADYQTQIAAVWTPSTSFHENALTYDLNGNIKTLTRKGASGVTLDQLSYNYTTTGSPITDNNGNQLLKVTDAGDDLSGFVDGVNSGYDYTYDLNGNLTRDENKSVTSITYNHLNLPAVVTKTTNEYVKYTYDAAGTKIRQEVFNASAALQKRTDYAGEFVYENDTLRFVNHEEGRVVINHEGTNLLAHVNVTSTAQFTANQNVSFAPVQLSGKNYMQITCNQSTSTPGAYPIGGLLTVEPNVQYTFRVKGYLTAGGSARLYVTQGSGTTSLLWPGTSLPVESGNEKWIEATFTVPNGVTNVRVGVLWATPVVNSKVLISEVQMNKVDPEYQYHLKDHLGNVRMTFTTEPDVEVNTASFESPAQTTESGQFLRYEGSKRVQSTIFDRTNGAATGYSQRLNGTTNEKFGLAKSMSVMPGDTIKAEVFAKYADPVTSNWNTAMNNLMTAIVNNTGGIVATESGYTSSTSSFGYAGLVNTSGSSGGPKAYLNWIVFDRDYNLLDGGYIRMSTAAREYGQDVAHERLYKDIYIKQPGYVYIYLSNEETTPVEVFFDDFDVEHRQSAVVQSEDYYPFGLTFNSYQRENSTKNKYLYNGFEKQEDLNLEIYDYQARTYDPALGRFMQVDPATELMRRYSPYAYAFDNPIRFTDPDGMMPEEANGDGPCGNKPCPEQQQQQQEVPQEEPNIFKKALVAIFLGLAEVGESFNQDEDASFEENLVTGTNVVADAIMATQGHKEILQPSSTGSNATSKIDDAAAQTKGTVDEVAEAAVKTAPSFVVDAKGTAYPVPKNATGPTPLLDKAGNVKGYEFTGGAGGANGQVSSMRMMNATPARGNAPAYPGGYIKYENAQGQGVDPYSGRTGSKTATHYALPILPDPL